MNKRGRTRVARTALGVGGAVAAVVVSASPAFACSAVMGPLTLTPSSAKAGSTISTTATGLKPFPARYDVFFGGACMTFSGKLLKTISTNGQGGWSNVKLRIPVSAKPGTYALCGIEAYPDPGQTATTHNSFTVI